jgi:hypothetical protein
MKLTAGTVVKKLKQRGAVTSICSNNVCMVLYMTLLENYTKATRNSYRSSELAGGQRAGVEEFLWCKRHATRPS